MPSSSSSQSPRRPRSEFRWAAYLFLRALGLIYLAAFASLWVQVDGLIGSQGILPIAPYLEAIAPQVGDAPYLALPTLSWLDAGDKFLHVQCAAGVVLSLMLAAGFLPWLAAPLLWLLYLSLTCAGQLFLGFQWENLLLETGFLAIWIAPWVLVSRVGRDPDPPRVVIILLQFVLLKLMFLSGFVKLASRDPAWWDLTALTYHYLSQPLPPWTAWYVDKLPLWFHKACCAVMFFIEFVAPFFVFGPRFARRIAAFLLILLQVVIIVTGNYAYFNLLTMALCIPLLDDGLFKALYADRPPRNARIAMGRSVVVGAVAAYLAVFNVTVLAAGLRHPIPWPEPVLRHVGAAHAFRSVNSYGLFAVMTKGRDEIVFEGSDDGVTWRTHELPSKPGDVMRAPSFVAPHQPRLDWQLWFAALGDIRGNRWVLNVMARLLEGSEPVLDLFDTNPFPDSPPRYVRASLSTYRFSTFAERRATGAWWTRTEKGLYCPPVSLNRRTS